MVTLNAYNARRYVIAVRGADYASKLFQIAFGKDGSLFVTLPYLKGFPGRLGVVNVPADHVDGASISFGNEAPVTSHLVKLSHHPSGTAHFSQDGKIHSSVRKEGMPLSSTNCHVFTVMIQGMQFFEQLSSKDRATEDRGIVPFGTSKAPDAVKLVGYMYSRAELARRTGNMTSPWVPCILPSGERRLGICLRTPFEYEGQPYFLVLTYTEIPTIVQGETVHLSLMGGFDDAATSFLLCFYPERGDFAELESKVGCVDR